MASPRACVCPQERSPVNGFVFASVGPSPPAMGAGETTITLAAAAIAGVDEVYAVGDLRLRTIHTPGHTPGSTCFVLEGHPVLFSGDTLFPGGPGNTFGSSEAFAQIVQSIDRRLLTLPSEMIVMPGHGLDTTVGEERPHLDEWIERGW